jgi:hypothetical protein
MFHKIVFDFDEQEVAEELQKKLLTFKNDTIFDHACNLTDSQYRIGSSEWIIWIDEDIIEKYNNLYTEFGKMKGIESFEKINKTVMPNYYKLVRRWDTATDEEKEPFKELIFNLFDGKCEILCKRNSGIVDILIKKEGYNPISLYMLPNGNIESRSGPLPHNFFYYRLFSEKISELFDYCDNNKKRNIIKNMIKMTSQGFDKS